ncbi:MAG: hypothetical protein AAFP19_10255 [Bacteroidota bacterium]
MKKEEIEVLIAEGRLDEVLSFFLTCTEEELRERGVLLKGRYNYLKLKTEQGSISLSDEMLEMNNLRTTLLALSKKYFEVRKEYIGTKGTTPDQQLFDLLNSINPDILNSFKRGEPSVRVFIHQENYNNLFRLSGETQNKFLKIYDTGESALITRAEPRKTYYIYDNKYGLAIGCVLHYIGNQRLGFK